MTPKASGCCSHNPAQVKALQGRQSDRREAQRIAEFLPDGRLGPSFLPPREIQQWRQLLRHRLSLLEQRHEGHHQIHDLCETAGRKLSAVASDLRGVTCRGIVEAMIAGQDSPDRLSRKVRGSLRKKEKLIQASLHGCCEDTHRLLLKVFYEHYQFLSQQVQAFESEIARHRMPSRSRRC